MGSLRISLAGSGALLMDGARGAFDDAVQRRVWAVAKAALAQDGVRESVPGMNNLLVVFDPCETEAAHLRRTLEVLWGEAAATDVDGAHHTVAVTYGGAGGEDLLLWAAHCGMAVEEIIRRHAGATYRVAAIGAMPGFPYLSGLDPRLAWGRRSMPRLRVAEGAVVIGGAQAGIMPMTAPSGWHVVGCCNLRLFDPTASNPVLLKPGDTVRFTVADILP